MSKMNNQYWKGKESFYGSDAEFDNKQAKRMHKTRDKKRILNILLILDVSGSMSGSRIDRVNASVKNIIRALRKREDLDCQIKIGVLEFSDRAKWITPQPIPLEDFVFTSVEAQPWYTAYAHAFTELEKKLHSSAFMNPLLGDYFPPLILFISDGEPVDPLEYSDALANLKNNRWFRKAAKYAIAVGSEANDRTVATVLSQFTGVVENVRYAESGEAISQIVEYVAIRAAEAMTSVYSPMYNDLSGTGSIFIKPDETLFDTMFDTH